MRIRVVDLETAGFEAADRVCQVGRCDWYDGVIDKFPLEHFINPGISIPAVASAIHHIVDADVADAPQFAFAWEQFHRDDAVYAYAAHNAKFERQWITDELIGGKPWICTYRCSLRSWPEAPSHSNQALRYWLALPVDRDFASPAHAAGPDAYVTAHLLDVLVKRHHIDELIAWSAQPALLTMVRFGKHRGARWENVPSDYLDWMCRQQDMDEDAIFTAKHHLSERRNR